MLYLITLERELELQPRFFGPRLREVLEQKLISEVEGTCSGKHGFIICVTGMGNVGKGSIREGLGTALFKVQYSCVVLRPFKGEVIDCVVSSVSKVGFFADAGPLQLFISNHLIPEDFEYSATGEPAFVSTDEAVRVQAGAEVRLRIVGARMDASEIFCLGTIKEDYLGVISQPSGM
ncbi:DNA-directed RNA polymerase II subunit RPB7 [Coccomyxa sp. Obi]|nr:DNA-directed RNA polymerase II subunit RPB7 [Coccomyxa sp. Obi]